MTKQMQATLETRFGTYRVSALDKYVANLLINGPCVGLAYELYQKLHAPMYIATDFNTNIHVFVYYDGMCIDGLGRHNHYNINDSNVSLLPPHVARALSNGQDREGLRFLAEQVLALKEPYEELSSEHMRSWAEAKQVEMETPSIWEKISRNLFNAVGGLFVFGVLFNFIWLTLFSSFNNLANMFVYLLFEQNNPATRGSALALCFLLTFWVLVCALVIHLCISFVRWSRGRLFDDEHIEYIWLNNDNIEIASHRKENK